MLMPMRVLMFGWELPPFNSGGLGVACYGLANALSDQNVDITFVLPKRLDVKSNKFRVVFADVDGFNWPQMSPYTKAQDVAPEVMRSLLSAVRLYGHRAVKIAKDHPHDIIHAHDWLCYPAGVTAQGASCKPLVSHIHATEYDRSGGSSADPIVYGVEKQGFDKAAAVIAVSNFTKNVLARYYATPGEKVAVVHNGINPDEFHPAASPPDLLLPLKVAGFKIVLYVGRITLSKGPDHLLHAAKQVLSLQPKTVFLFVGSGEMENQIINLAASMGISDRVLFAGFLRGKLLEQAYQAADLFIMPSVSEPFGLTALEAMANGTPVIVSKQTGVSETINHALKVDFWDTQEMANKIVTALRFPSLHLTLKSNGSREVKGISWSAAAAKTIEVYKKVLSA